MAKNPKILESVYSIRDIQIFGAGFRRMKEVDEANRNVNHASFWLTVHRQTIASFPNFFVYLARILILVCAGVLSSRGINHPVGTIAISFAATASLSSTFKFDVCCDESSGNVWSGRTDLQNRRYDAGDRRTGASGFLRRNSDDRVFRCDIFLSGNGEKSARSF